MNEVSHPYWERVRPNLTGRTVVVVGGTGGVGEGVVRALLDDGAFVIATGRDTVRSAAFAARLADLTTSEALSVQTLDAESADLEDQVTALRNSFGLFDGVIISVASWGDQGSKPVLALTDREWSGLLDGNVTSVFRLLRAFEPHTRRSGMLAQLNGMSAELPFPGNAGVALSAAATKSLTRTLAAELEGRGPRVYQVILGVVRTRERQRAGIDDPRWLRGEEIGAHLAGLLAGTSELADSVVSYLVDPSGPRRQVPGL